MAPYPFAPFVVWLVAGAIKFAINSIRSRAPAWEQIGYGGMPSTHTTIVTTTAALVGLREGWTTAPFGVAIALGFIVIMDALSLRKQIGTQARLINALMVDDPGHRAIRERIGHHWTEVVGGLIVGLGCALALDRLGR